MPSAASNELESLHAHPPLVKHPAVLFSLGALALLTLVSAAGGGSLLEPLQWWFIAPATHLFLERERGYGYQRRGPLSTPRSWPFGVAALTLPLWGLAHFVPALLPVVMLGVVVLAGMAFACVGMILPHPSLREHGRRVHAGCWIAVVVMALILAINPPQGIDLWMVVMPPALVTMGAVLHAAELCEQEEAIGRSYAARRDSQREREHARRIHELRRLRDPFSRIAGEDDEPGADEPPERRRPADLLRGMEPPQQGSHTRARERPGLPGEGTALPTPGDDATGRTTSGGEASRTALR